MWQPRFPVIDPVATGENIVRLRRERGLSVRDLQAYFGFEEPQAIYKWQRGKSLPSVDNLYALGRLLDVPMDEILVSITQMQSSTYAEQQAAARCSALYLGRLFWMRHDLGGARANFAGLLRHRPKWGGRLHLPGRLPNGCLDSSQKRALKAKDGDVSLIKAEGQIGGVRACERALAGA
ncbi:MAG TPA: helix-turn-helix transcriptional regulator [Terriglobales bacterium]|nr:helix-turn-helix transcriptional regulator [Terriglobales bacterium]